jgi:hypothetical protein
MAQRPNHEAHVAGNPAHEHHPTGAHSHGDHVHHEDPIHPTTRRRISWTGIAGQACAYLGVGVLTCGSVLAMWSYFGGPAAYLPAGGLVAAIGQMLLFLGVVTLISNGMEQTTIEVAWRIDHLAEEVHHLGLALDDLEQTHRTTHATGMHIHGEAESTRREAA